MKITLISDFIKGKVIKKTVTAVLLSMSMLAVPAAQAQAQTQAQTQTQTLIQTYAGGNAQTSSVPDMEADNVVAQWILKGIIYWLLDKALDVAIELIYGDDPHDKKDGCDFIIQYGTTCPSTCCGDSDDEWP